MSTKRVKQHTYINKLPFVYVYLQPTLDTYVVVNVIITIVGGKTYAYIYALRIVSALHCTVRRNETVGG